MASSTSFYLSPHPLLFTFPPKLLPNSSFSPSRFNPIYHNNNHPLYFSLSSTQSLSNPPISPLLNHTHLPFSPSNSPQPSIHHNFLYNKCRELLHLSVLYSDVDLVISVHSLVLKLGDDNYLLNSLISAYLKLGFLKFAYKVFTGISTPDVVSYTAIISGFAKFGYEFQAVVMFMRMRERERGIEPNEFTFVAFLTACTRINVLNLGVQIHSLTIKLGYVFSTYVAKCHCIVSVVISIMHFRCLMKCLREILHLAIQLYRVFSELMYDNVFSCFAKCKELMRLELISFTYEYFMCEC